MNKSFKHYLSIEIEANGFRLSPKDALVTASNIQILFSERTGWFSAPKPIHINELCNAY